MKKIILCVVLVLSGLTCFSSYAGIPQGTSKNTSVTVVSDTTGNDNDDNADADDAAQSDASSINAAIDSAMDQAFGGTDQDNASDNDSKGVWDMDSDFGSHFVLMVLLIVFGLPVLLVAIILYFVYRNRRARYELQKTAIEKGLNPNTIYRTGAADTPNTAYIPKDISKNMPDSVTPNEILWEKGIKQMCLGIGLAVLLGIICDAKLSVIGLLIFFIGLGKAIISKTRRDPAGNPDDNPINQEEKTTDKNTTQE